MPHTSRQAQDNQVCRLGLPLCGMESDGGNDEGRFIRGQFDSNGDGVFGDTSKMLNAGACTINGRDTAAETATITSTDANGAATGQFALPNYSWKGSYSLPAGSSVRSLAALSPDLLPSFAAVASCNLSGNGTATAHRTIGLFWCGERFRSRVRWNGSARSTTFVSAIKLTASISGADIAPAGTARVTVVNPSPGGGRSNSLKFTKQ